MPRGPSGAFRLSFGLFCALLPKLSAAQAQDSLPHATETVSVGYVLVPFVVADHKGRPLRDLRRKDVTLLVDGVAVKTDLFERSDDAPVSFAILLDGSGSMGLSGKMEGARSALGELVARRRPGDDFSLHVFSSGEIREVVPFTSDGKAILRALDEIEPFGKTAFFDALALMPDKSLLGGNGSRAIILLTDGFDNASKLSREALAELLEGIDVPVFPLGLWSPSAASSAASASSAPAAIAGAREAWLDRDVLERLAGASGGRLAIVGDPGKLGEAVGMIERDLRSQYLIGFSPSGQGAVKYRRISLKFKKRSRVVRVRSGYRGTAPAP